MKIRNAFAQTVTKKLNPLMETRDFKFGYSSALLTAQSHGIKWASDFLQEKNESMARKVYVPIGIVHYWQGYARGLDVARLRSDFQKFLTHSGYCTPPGRAACALRSAKTLREFRQYEYAGLVRLQADEEQE